MAAKKVLVVEDQDDFRMVMRMIIELNGYEVVEATDGIEAIDKAEKQQPDLIFMDIGLPRLDGVAATRTIKALGCCSDTPVFAVTAYHHVRDSAMDAGCSGIIEKPVDFSRVEQVLAQHLA